MNPAHYFPLEKGVYEVAPGLRKLGTPFGNGERDGYFLQFDEQLGQFLESKRACRRENLHKYYAKKDLAPSSEAALVSLLIERLCAEHPGLFSLSESSKGKRLVCRFTGETLHLDSQGKLLGVEALQPPPNPPYADAIDALVSQMPEDIALTQVGEGGTDWLAVGHVCSPSHWSITDKIGQSFFEVHEYVPGAEKMNRTASQLVQGAIQKGPYVRFVWSFVTDNRLNQNPYPPAGFTAEQWHSAPLNLSTECPFFLRIERQVTWGLPSVKAFAFAIRVYFRSAPEIRCNPAERDLLKSTLQSMTVASKRYKRVPEDLSALFSWLG